MFEVTWSLPFIAPIKGIENAVESWDILSGKVDVPQNKSIVVIGGGIVGCETAEYLAEKDYKVHVLEMLPSIANGLEYVNRLVLDVTLQQMKIDVVVNASVTDVDSSKVTYTVDGAEHAIDCDLIVVSTGQKPYVPAVVKELQDRNIRVLKLGDAEKVGKIFNATAEGFHKAHDLF